MKIIKKSNTKHVTKDNGIDVSYYLEKNFELHYNIQPPLSSQDWHYHKIITEIIFIIEGELTLKWKENGKTFEKIVEEGDMIEVEDDLHTFYNHTSKPAKFFVIKMNLKQVDSNLLFKSDKHVLDNN